MIVIATRHIAGVLAVLASVPTLGGAQVPQDLSLEVDACNYLTTRIELLKRGEAIEALRAELLSDVQYDGLSEETVGLFRGLVAACDKALTARSSLDDAKREAEAKALEGLLKAGVAYATGAGALVVGNSALSAASSAGRDFGSLQDVILQDLSSLQFDLALLRGRLESEVEERRAFVHPRDFVLHLSASAAAKPEERISLVATALESSPMLQPAALDLGLYYYSAGDVDRCFEYCDRVIEAHPRMLRRDAYRAHAYFLKAHMALRAGDHDRAREWSTLGLEDKGGHSGLLSTKATALAMSGQYSSAMEILNRLELILPNDGAVHYNLACCVVQTGGDYDQALAELRKALEKGWSDIAWARKDDDLKPLWQKRSRELEELMGIRLRVALMERAFVTDPVLIRNLGEFGLENLTVRVRPVLQEQGADVDAIEATIGSLPVNGTFRIDDHRIDARRLKGLQVEAEGGQGRYRAFISIEQLRKAAVVERDLQRQRSLGS